MFIFCLIAEFNVSFSRCTVPTVLCCCNSAISYFVFLLPLQCPLKQRALLCFVCMYVQFTQVILFLFMLKWSYSFFFLIFLPNTILKNPHRVTLCTCSSLHLEYRARDGLAGPNTGILSFSKFWQIVWQCGGSGLIPHSGPWGFLAPAHPGQHSILPTFLFARLISILVGAR